MPQDSQPYGMSEIERRFILRREQAEELIQRVAPRLALDVYDEARPIGYTRTTYLDTDDYILYRSCDGPVSRRVRIREYASATDTDAAPFLTGVCALELKESSGLIRTKARLRAPAGVVGYIVENRGAIPDTLRKELSGMQALKPLEQCLSAEKLEPRVTTWYRRASLSGEGGRVRVTLDEGVRFCRPVRVGSPGEYAEPLDVIGHGPGRVVEVKYSGEPPEWLTEAMKGLPETERFSKFRDAMRALERVDAGTQPGRVTRPIAIPAVKIVRKE